MQIKQLRELIKDLPDEAEVVMSVDFGFAPVCEEDSCAAQGPEGEVMLFIAPCTCGIENEAMEIPLKSSDFTEPSLS
jgi:hypothetical protein